MPRLKICVASGCEDLALSGLSHCADHEAARQARLKQRRARAQTSAAAIAGRRLYADPRWKIARRWFLRRQPLCADCGDLGVIEPASDVDHVTPHRGDCNLFWD